MPRDYWVTYSGRQAGQVIAGLQVLLEGNKLDEQEGEAARSIQRKLRSASLKGEDITMVPLNGKEHELVSQVEAALWR